MAVGKLFLKSAALLNFAIAALHVAIIGVGSRAYLYLGADGMAALAAQGSWIPALVTWGLTAIFVVFGLYALAGAGVIHGLPFVQAGLFVIGTIFTLRGLILMLDLMRLSRGAGYPPRQTVFSAIALGIGLMYLAGALARGTESIGGAHAAD